MVSRNLQIVIDKYNEKGIVRILDEKIYWFNGKRFEYWCESPADGFAFMHKGTLYFRYDFQMFFWKRNKFEITKKIKSSHPYFHFVIL